MQTLRIKASFACWVRRVSASTNRGAGLLPLCLFLMAMTAPGCKKDVANEASDSDANGYLCLKCGTKLYTDRSVFLGPQCSKCQQDTLVEVVGYRCEKDQHLTIRPSRGDSRGAASCERCQTPLVNAMYLPRAKDLQAWGAAKSQP